MNITVLGTGLVGNAIVKDLAREENFSVKAVDINQQALQKLESEVSVKGVKADLSIGDNVPAVVAGSDLV